MCDMLILLKKVQIGTKTATDRENSNFTFIFKKIFIFLKSRFDC